MISKPRLEVRKEQPYAAIRIQVPIPFGKFMTPLWAEVHNWLESQRITSSGPALIRYLTTDMSKKLDIDVGFAIEKVVTGDERVRIDILPAGCYAVLSYTGPYKGKGIFKANVALLEWAEENHIVWQTSNVDNIEWWGSRVEWYLTDPGKEPDTKKYQAELAFLATDTQKS